MIGFSIGFLPKVSTVSTHPYFLGRSDDREQPGKKKTHTISVCLISSCGSSHSVLHGFVTRDPNKKNRTVQLASHFWRLSVGVLFTLEKTMCSRATSRGAGSEARGESREKGNLIVTIPKPPVAQGAGGIRHFVSGSSWHTFLLKAFL